MARIVGRMPNQQELDQIRTDLAFDAAIGRGVFSTDVTAIDYAGRWMYMGTSGGCHAFKHRGTRRYLHIGIV